MDVDEVAWTVTEASGEVITTGKREALAYLEPFVVNDKTPKGQIPVIEGWNKMQARLIELGEMKSK